MMQWLVQSSLLLALVSAPLLLIHPFLLKRLGARSCYLLWSALPLVLILPLVPSYHFSPTENLALLETLLITASHAQQSIQASSTLSNLFWLWLAGVLFMAVWSGLSAWQLKRQLRHSRQFTNSKLNVFICCDNQGPAIFGVLRPSLILPADFHQRFSRPQRQLILQHELAHWRRGDLHANLLAIGLLCLFWFHPLIWLAYRRYRADQELACDADVLKQHPGSTQFCYANALLAAMQSVPTPSVQFQPFCHHYGATQSMKERLLQLKQQQGFSKTPALILLTALLAGALLWQQPLQAKSNANLHSTGPTAIQRIEPRYPIEAAQQRIEGFVQLQYNIEADGSTSNIRVIHAQPESVFEQEAVRALQHWRYQPDPNPAANLGLKVQLDFAMDYDPAQDMERIMVKPEA